MTREKAMDIFKCLAWHDARPDVEDIEQAIKVLDQDSALDKIRTEIEGLVFIEDIEQAIKTLDQESVLDKIRTEMKGMTPTYHNLDWSITDLVPISEVLKIIDKYKAESEEEE